MTTTTAEILAVDEFSGETCTKSFKIVELHDGIILKVFHMPKTPLQWEMFEICMRDFNQNIEEIKEKGLMLEKERKEGRLDPNRLLFALRINFR